MKGRDEWNSKMGKNKNYLFINDNVFRGIFVIAHGQNANVILDNFIPPHSMIYSNPDLCELANLQLICPKISTSSGIFRYILWTARKGYTCIPICILR